MLQLQGASEIAVGSRYVRYESCINQDPKQIAHFAIQWAFIHLQGIVCDPQLLVIDPVVVVRSLTLRSPGLPKVF